MRLLASLSLLTMTLLLAGCDSREKSTTAAPASECTRIASPVQRLACFDAAAGTPPAQPMGQAVASGVATATASGAAAMASDRSVIASLVRRNEAARRDGGSQFLLSRWPDNDPERSQIVMSAPALGSAASRPYLAVSCLSGITRLQLLISEPVSANRMNVRLLMDGRPLSDASPWQVLETGDVIDAGRGLVAIDLLRRVGSGSRLQTQSDYPPIDGLEFDATGLKEQIAQEREACHW